MNAREFVAKWERVQLTERSAAQQHFLDLCEVVDHPKPAAMDPTGESFTFEKGAGKQGGGDGWADVWKRGFFGWEYKGKHKDLDVAYAQLLQYREALENPPLLVVCDLGRIVVRTNFTGTKTEVHEVPLAQLATPRGLEVLRAVFHAPERLRPGATIDLASHYEAPFRLIRTHVAPQRERSRSTVAGWWLHERARPALRRRLRERRSFGLVRRGALIPDRFATHSSSSSSSLGPWQDRPRSGIPTRRADRAVYGTIDSLW